MRTLIPIIVASLVLTGISSYLSSYKLDSMDGKVYVYRERFFYFIMALAMAVFVGLRTSGNDTGTYIDLYERIQLEGSVFSGIDWFKLAGAPGLHLLQNILKSLGASSQDYLMLCALFTVLVYLWFIRKYSTDIWLSIYYFITMGVYTFAMAAIKQTMCVAFLLLATDCAIEKKWGRYLIWMLVAELFHPYAFVYFIIPFLFFRPWSGATVFLIFGTIIVSFSLSRFMGGIMSLTESLGANYSENEFIGAGINIFRVLVVWVPVVLSFWGRNYFRKSEDRATNLVINASMINALIMFIGLFGTANYFARLANYFLIFQTLSLPWLFRIFEEKSKKIVIMLSVIAFAVYFYYQCVLANGTFDNMYSFMSVIKYITHSY